VERGGLFVHSRKKEGKYASGCAKGKERKISACASKERRPGQEARIDLRKRGGGIGKKRGNSEISPFCDFCKKNGRRRFFPSRRKREAGGPEKKRLGGRHVRSRDAR